jgi:branched-chain amino acid aminotransferase
MISEPRAGQLVWLDGEFLPWADATMHVSAHHYGFGVFEGVRSYACDGGTSIFRLDDHTKRLLRSAQIMKMSVPQPYDREALNHVQIEILRRNKLGDAYLRPFVFYAGALGLRPSTRDLSIHVAVLALEWADRRSVERPASLRGLVLRTSSFARSSAHSLLSKAKANGYYVGGMLALQEAQACGADDALQLDHDGFVTETTGANLFVVKAGKLRTPPLSVVLEGITRDTIMAFAVDLGWSVSEEPLTREDIYTADEVFLTGTAMEVTPVLELDGRRIGTGTRGPITERLQTMYAAQVHGHGEHRAEWLSRV